MMGENIIFIGIAVVIGGVILAIAAYYVARFMRGSIKLSMPLMAFNAGDTITGSFDLHTKKAIEGNRLIVSLIGTEETKTHRDGESETHSNEIFRDEVLLEGVKTYTAGSKAKYDFAIATPDAQAPDFLNSKVGQALSVASQLLGNRSTRLKWQIEARLDAKGVDLAATKKISINTN
jgi:hypothetical protein